MSELDDKECESWTDVDVWYWVFENGFEQEHAEVLWNHQVDGKSLVHMKKDQLFGMCKTLDKRKTSDMWHRIKGLKKHVPKQRKSFLRSKNRPAPVEADYSDEDGDFSGSSDFSDEDNPEEEHTDEMGDSQTTLHDLLKLRLQEFKQEQQAQGEEQDLYIAPDSQDNYEEFDTAPDDEQLYLTPPGEEEDDDAPPPPPRDPVGANNLSSIQGAPKLPPRPGSKPSLSPGHRPLPTLSQKPLPSPVHKRMPSPGRSSVNSDENSGSEEYVVPDPVAADSEEMYLDPNESNEPDDCGEEYLDPNEVPRPEPPLPAPPTQRRDKSPMRTMPNGRHSSLPPKPAPKLELPPSQPPSQKPSSIKLFNSIKSSFENKTTVPKPPIPTSNKPKPQGGSVWQIQKNLKSSQVPQPNPPRPAIPTPTPSQPSQLPTPPLPKIPARPARETPSPRPSEPVRPGRVAEPVRPPMPVAPRPRPTFIRDENDLSNCPWFHESLDRNRASAALQRHRKEGAFVVRKSDKDVKFPYSLSLYYKGGIRNLQIGLREDKKYALGKIKEGEGRFSSVKELIDYHRTHDVVLANNDGRTCLVEPVPLP